MGNCLKFFVALFAVVTFTMPSLFAQDYAADTTGLWSDGSNWTGGSVPSTGIARIAGSGRNNSVVTLDDAQALTGTGGRFIFGQGGTAGSLTIVSGGSLITSGTTVHRLGQISAFTTTVENGGSLIVQNADVSSSAGSSVIVNGGNLDFLRNFLQEDATVQINGSSATFDVGINYSTTNDSTLEFNLDAGGVSSLDVGGQLTISPAANLVVDASAYTPGATTVTLATYSSLANTSEFAETLIAPSGYDVDVVYGATSLDLVFTTAVPEPSSIAFLSLLSLVTLRRKRS